MDSSEQFDKVTHLYVPLELFLLGHPMVALQYPRAGLGSGQAQHPALRTGESQGGPLQYPLEGVGWGPVAPHPSLECPVALLQHPLRGLRTSRTGHYSRGDVHVELPRPAQGKRTWKQNVGGS